MNFVDIFAAFQAKSHMVTRVTVTVFGIKSTDMMFEGVLILLSQHSKIRGAFMRIYI
jgi:hypothetical protein